MPTVEEMPRRAHVHAVLGERARMENMDSMLKNRRMQTPSKVTRTGEFNVVHFV